MQDTAAARAAFRAASRQARCLAWPVVALRLLDSGAGIAQALCMARLLAAVFAPGKTFQLAATALFAALIPLRAALGVAADRLGFEAGARGRTRLRADSLGRMLAAGPALLRTTTSGDLVTTAIDRVEAHEGVFARYVPASLGAVLVPLLVATAASFVSLYAAAILLGCAVLVPAGQAAFGIGAAAASRGQFLALARLQSRFLDRVRGIATIVTLGRAADEAAALARAADELRRRTMRVLRVAFLSSVTIDAAAAIALIAIAIHFHGRVATGPLFCLLLVPEFMAPFRRYAAAYQDRLHATGAAAAIAALPPLPAPSRPAVIRTVEARGIAVAFEQVRFTWDASRGPAIDGLSFFVAPGETVVLAGPSGAGKSTVLELLLGFVEPEQGRILLNGHPLADLVPAARARLVAWISQRPALFAGTIRDNILFARPDASPEEVARAAQLAQIDEFADALPHKLDTPIGEGGYGLSGGQAQRVAIARAFLKDAPLLLLDEPTAHLDPATEAAVLASLRRLAVGRTVVMAAHSAAAHAFGGRRIDLAAGRIRAARGAA